jgi:hypothetical protein
MLVVKGKPGVCGPEHGKVEQSEECSEIERDGWMKTTDKQS